MREFAKVSPLFWIHGNKRKQLGPEVQLIAIYLLTNPHANMVGVYYLPVSIMAYEGCVANRSKLIECSD